MSIFNGDRAIKDVKTLAIVLLVVVGTRVNEPTGWICVALLTFAIIVEPGRKHEPPVRFKRKEQRTGKQLL